VTHPRMGLSVEIVAEATGDFPIIVVVTRELVLPELAEGEAIGLVALVFPAAQEEEAKAARVEELRVGQDRRELVEPVPIEQLAHWLTVPVFARRRVTGALSTGDIVFDPGDERPCPLELVVAADRMLRLHLTLMFEVVLRTGVFDPATRRRLAERVR
jgi:hypothetical protein